MAIPADTGTLSDAEILHLLRTQVPASRRAWTTRRYRPILSPRRPGRPAPPLPIAAAGSRWPAAWGC
jgi:hypothetical protein